MRLSDFIRLHKDAIASAWERFAASRGAVGARMNSLALRDHIEPMLEAIALDISLPQSRAAQHEKSLGPVPGHPDTPHTAAETHAVLRAKDGFDVNQLVAEYRALRASVLRLWFDSLGDEPPDAEQVVRFNEAIDQAIAESLACFNTHVEQTRNLLLGMLGHDMRSPLQTIQMTAQFLSALHLDERIEASAHHLMCAGARMQALLDDLVDFNRTRLGLGIRIHPAPTDLGQAFREEVEQLATAHRDRRIALAVRGDCTGHWDAMRLRQVLANLVTNAVRHGGAEGGIEVDLDGEGERLRFEVRNRGPTLPPGFLEGMFDPLSSGDVLARDDAHSLGLGLYISREITRAHGGAIAAHSDEGLTCFSVELPRERRADPRRA